MALFTKTSRFRPKAVITGVSVLLVLSVSAVTAWWFLRSHPVTDAEARQLLSHIHSVGVSDPDEVCRFALFDKKCQRSIDAGLAEQVGSQQTIVCTWPLTGGDGTRVVEVENINADGQRYRTSVAVSWDSTQLTAWPMPYWAYPTDDLPVDPITSTAPVSLPTTVVVGEGERGDPCLHPDSTH